MYILCTILRVRLLYIFLHIDIESDCCQCFLTGQENDLDYEDLEDEKDVESQPDGKCCEADVIIINVIIFIYKYSTINSNRYNCSVVLHKDYN